MLTRVCNATTATQGSSAAIVPTAPRAWWPQAVTALAALSMSLVPQPPPTRARRVVLPPSFRRLAAASKPTAAARPGPGSESQPPAHQRLALAAPSGGLACRWGRRRDGLPGDDAPSPATPPAVLGMGTGAAASPTKGLDMAPGSGPDEQAERNGEGSVLDRLNGPAARRSTWPSCTGSPVAAGCSSGGRRSPCTDQRPPPLLGGLQRSPAGRPGRAGAALPPGGRACAGLFDLLCRPSDMAFSRHPLSLRHLLQTLGGRGARERGAGGVKDSHPSVPFADFLEGGELSPVTRSKAAHGAPGGRATDPSLPGAQPPALGSGHFSLAAALGTMPRRALRDPGAEADHEAAVGRWLRGEVRPMGCRPIWAVAVDRYTSLSPLAKRTTRAEAAAARLARARQHTPKRWPLRPAGAPSWCPHPQAPARDRDRDHDREQRVGRASGGGSVMIGSGRPYRAVVWTPPMRTRNVMSRAQRMLGSLLTEDAEALGVDPDGVRALVTVGPWVCWLQAGGDVVLWEASTGTHAGTIPWTCPSHRPVPHSPFPPFAYPHRPLLAPWTGLLAHVAPRSRADMARNLGLLATGCGCPSCLSLAAALHPTVRAHRPALACLCPDEVPRLVYAMITSRHVVACADGGRKRLLACTHWGDLVAWDLEGRRVLLRSRYQFEDSVALLPGSMFPFVTALLPYRAEEKGPATDSDPAAAPRDFLVAGCSDGRLALFDAQTLRLVRVLYRPPAVSAAPANGPETGAPAAGAASEWGMARAASTGSLPGPTPSDGADGDAAAAPEARGPVVACALVPWVTDGTDMGAGGGAGPGQEDPQQADEEPAAEALMMTLLAAGYGDGSVLIFDGLNYWQTLRLPPALAGPSAIGVTALAACPQEALELPPYKKLVPPMLWVAYTTAASPSGTCCPVDDVPPLEGKAAPVAPLLPLGAARPQLWAIVTPWVHFSRRAVVSPAEAAPPAAATISLCEALKATPARPSSSTCWSVGLCGPMHRMARADTVLPASVRRAGLCSGKWLLLCRPHRDPQPPSVDEGADTVSKQPALRHPPQQQPPPSPAQGQQPEGISGPSAAGSGEASQQLGAVADERATVRLSGTLFTSDELPAQLAASVGPSLLVTPCAMMAVSSPLPPCATYQQPDPHPSPQPSPAPPMALLADGPPSAGRPSTPLLGAAGGGASSSAVDDPEGPEDEAPLASRGRSMPRMPAAGGPATAGGRGPRKRSKYRLVQVGAKPTRPAAQPSLASSLATSYSPGFTVAAEAGRAGPEPPQDVSDYRYAERLLAPQPTSSGAALLGLGLGAAPVPARPQSAAQQPQAGHQGAPADPRRAQAAGSPSGGGPEGTGSIAAFPFLTPSGEPLVEGCAMDVQIFAPRLPVGCVLVHLAVAGPTVWTIFEGESASGVWECTGNSLLHTALEESEQRAVSPLIRNGICSFETRNWSVVAPMPRPPRLPMDMPHPRLTMGQMDLLAYALISSNESLERWLLEHSYPVDSCNRPHPLHEFVLNRNVPLIRAMLRLRANPNRRVGLGQTPLHLAVLKMGSGLLAEVARRMRESQAQARIQAAAAAAAAALQSTSSSAGGMVPRSDSTSALSRLSAGGDEGLLAAPDEPPRGVPEGSLGVSASGPGSLRSSRTPPGEEDGEDDRSTVRSGSPGSIYSALSPLHAPQLRAARSYDGAGSLGPPEDADGEPAKVRVTEDPVAANMNIVKLLVEEGRADTAIRDHEGNSALHLAAHAANLEAVTYLAEHRPLDPDADGATSSPARTPSPPRSVCSEVSAASGRPSGAVIGCGPLPAPSPLRRPATAPAGPTSSPKTPTSTCRTLTGTRPPPGHHVSLAGTAARPDGPDAAQRGLQPQQPRSVGLRPIHLAVTKRDVKILRCCWPRVRRQRPDALKMRTGLHLAVATQQPELAAFLMLYGADMDRPDSEGYTALETAIRNPGMLGVLLSTQPEFALGRESPMGEPDATNCHLCKKPFAKGLRKLTVTSTSRPALLQVRCDHCLHLVCPKCSSHTFPRLKISGVPSASPPDEPVRLCESCYAPVGEILQHPPPPSVAPPFASPAVTPPASPPPVSIVPPGLPPSPANGGGSGGSSGAHHQRSVSLAGSGALFGSTPGALGGSGAGANTLPPAVGRPSGLRSSASQRDLLGRPGMPPTATLASIPIGLGASVPAPESLGPLYQTQPLGSGSGRSLLGTSLMSSQSGLPPSHLHSARR
ncbi:hypothetical protein PAPYR_13164 [Paratrimastix pyriformis]|uniref:FYVE-type domain-containing protein n=1 Tax=Paratrimastix pyriformis TaxID=342808 RepID=A0ABQ8U293_9EUKA|nr:hypothetical protein PAPYR_13164 [Paratrimastix pyriformis]